MFVQTETTPNPNSLKFLPGKIVSNHGSFEITNKNEINNELVKNLLSVNGVEGIFLGKDLGTTEEIHPLMVGPQADRFVNGKINKKLMLVNQIGGEAQLNIIIGNTIRKRIDANEQTHKGSVAVFNSDFKDVFMSDSGNGKSYQQLILEGNLDNAFGNQYVGDYITALNEKRRELVEIHKDNPQLVLAIEESYNSSIKDIENNLLQQQTLVE